LGSRRKNLKRLSDHQPVPVAGFNSHLPMAVGMNADAGNDSDF
jgi:hypothetical protein